MNRNIIITRLTLVILMACGVAETGRAQPTGSAGYVAVVETDQGTIEIKLLPKAAPKAVKNFRFLVLGGHYNGLTFHRIINGFMIQGGDPKGDGTGGESIWGGSFEDEIDVESALYKRGYKRGVVAMANAGPDTNGCQFFIMHQDYPLPPKYVIIGEVIKGIEVVDALAETPTQRGADGQMSRPVTPPKMIKVSLKRSGS